VRALQIAGIKAHMISADKSVTFKSRSEPVHSNQFILRKGLVRLCQKKSMHVQPDAVVLMLQTAVL